MQKEEDIKEDALYKIFKMEKEFQKNNALNYKIQIK